MSTAEETWRNRTDGELEDAAANLDDYSQQGKEAILGEMRRRGAETADRGDFLTEGKQAIPNEMRRDGITGPPRRESAPKHESVIISDIHMSFWSMVFFMVKWVIASIPAVIILSLIVLAVYLLVIAPFLLGR